MLAGLDTQFTGGLGLSGGDVEGDRFGPYRVLRPIGEGGMGAVYLAEHTGPIHREVALKVIKLGMDSRQVVARFDAERQVLALMEHPNIAHVYDAGTSDGGRPYFVMEYVYGVAITTYCDQHLLNTRQRLQLFGRVCLAVQHAHQKGVIHRDIKPSNVLVTEQDGLPLPKVIDFGIAKATDQCGSEHTAFTLMGNFVGTPEYMSPEQADLNTSDIDTTTDVYSLGVLLYELLVGAPPFEGRWLRHAGMTELLRIIREEEAPTPSAKLTTLGDKASEVARHRRSDLATLRRELVGDVNWIVMKALEKDRQRRYASVSEMGADIRRHLEDQPVLASPPSNLYRAQKFIRRHKVLILAGFLIIISLVTGIIAFAWEARIAELRRREAEFHRTRANAQAAQALAERSRAEEQRARAEARRLEADVQRSEAETLYNGVRDLAKSMIFDVGDQIAQLQGATPAREILIRKSLEYLNRLAMHPRATPELRQELAEGYLKIGDLQGGPALANLANPTAAMDSIQKSVSLLEALAKGDPQNPRLRHDLIQAYLRRGRLQPLTADTDADSRHALALAEARMTAEPEDIEARRDLVSSLCVEIPAGSLTVSQTIPAEKQILRARPILQELLQKGSKDPEIRRELAWTYMRQAYLFFIRQEYEAALNSYAQALDQRTSLAREFPFNAQYGRDEAVALHEVGNMLLKLRHSGEASEAGRMAVAIQQQLVDRDARNVSFRQDLKRFQSTLALMLIMGPRNLSFAQGEPGKLPNDWEVSRSYSAEVRRIGCRDGLNCVVLFKTEMLPEIEFGYLLNSFRAESYRGRTVKLHAWLRVESVANDNRVQLWLRVDRHNGTGFFDNTRNRPVRSTDWTEIQIVGRVDDDAERIALGVLSYGGTRAWVDGMTFDIVNDTTPTTGNR
jgi:serine/threonine protein kinase